MRRSVLAGVTILIAALAFTGCAPKSTGAEAESATASPTASPTLTPSPSTTTTASPTTAPTMPPPATYTVPASCGDIASMPLVAPLIAGMMDIGAPEVPVMDYAQTLVGCGWMVGDATGGVITISKVDEATAQQTFEGISDSGATCDAYRGGSRCVVLLTRIDYPVDTYDVSFYRDDLWIELNSSNVDFGPALDDLIDYTWG